MNFSGHTSQKSNRAGRPAVGVRYPGAQRRLTRAEQPSERIERQPTRAEQPSERIARLPRRAETRSSAAPRPEYSARDAYAVRTAYTPRSRAQASARRAPKRAAPPLKLARRARRWAREVNAYKLTLVACALALICLLGMGAASAARYVDFAKKSALLNQTTFYDGITVNGESLSGLTLFDAIDKYTKRLGAVSAATNISINARGTTYTLDASAVQLHSSINSTLTLAYSIARSGSFDERYAKVQQLKQQGLDFTLDKGFNESALRAKIAEISADVDVPARDAAPTDFNPETGEFAFEGEQVGYRLDADGLYARVAEAIARGDVAASIDADVATLAPKYDLEYLKAHFGRITVAKTKATDNEQRNKNIALALATLNGLILQPGETFSFNAATGERSEAKGYMPAGAYKNGVLIQEYGGGVCQVSTTLYHAANQADLEIVKRSHHSRPVSYVGIGLDAAVNYPDQDMQFKNNTEFPIYIFARFDKPYLVIKLYGRKLDAGEYIKLVSEKTETVPAPEGVRVLPDPTIPEGKQITENAREGYRAVSYKVYCDADGNEIKRETLANSYYKPAQMTLRTGTGAAAN